MCVYIGAMKDAIGCYMILPYQDGLARKSGLVILLLPAQRRAQKDGIVWILPYLNEFHIICVDYFTPSQWIPQHPKGFS